MNGIYSNHIFFGEPANLLNVVFEFLHVLFSSCTRPSAIRLFEMPPSVSAALQVVRIFLPLRFKPFPFGAFIFLQHHAHSRCSCPNRSLSANFSHLLQETANFGRLILPLLLRYRSKPQLLVGFLTKKKKINSRNFSLA